jgi:hypothetical protein
MKNFEKLLLKFVLFLKRYISLQKNITDMDTTTVFVHVKDGGKYHNNIIYLSLKKSFEDEIEDEIILIKYGSIRSFVPVSALSINDKILLSAACLGTYGDIKITVEEWLCALNRLGSKEKLQEWNFIINKMKAA